jgi:hypothetical protein
LVEQAELVAFFIGLDRLSGRDHPDDFASGHPLNIVTRMDAILLGNHFGDSDLVFGSDFGYKGKSSSLP